MSNPRLSAAFFYIRILMILFTTTFVAAKTVAKYQEEKKQAPPVVTEPIDPASFSNPEVKELARKVKILSGDLNKLQTQAAKANILKEVFEKPGLAYLLVATAFIAPILQCLERRYR